MSYDVQLQHGLLRHQTFETEVAHVQRSVAPVQDEFCHGSTDGGGLLKAMAAEAGGEVHVVDQGVHADDGVLVEGVVVVETCPGAGDLTGGTRRT